MKFKYVHNNINVTNLDQSIKFYKEALGLEIKNDKPAEDGSFRLVFMGNDENPSEIELTWLRDKEGAYNLGDNEIHFAFVVDDFDAAYELHQKLGVICYENKDMGLYFIADPDGYWTEIIPTR
ncbi:MAG: VOC family protein [Clostridiales Family XIII bacterium]|nr:VOC family protein [Clostridiales Family XIII bacterium]